MFYTYRQNNSGGWFIDTDDIGYNTIIEADSPRDADARAESIGIYFDGCLKGTDCDCCGDRFSRQWNREPGDPVPSLYGEPIDLTDIPESVRIHYR